MANLINTINFKSEYSENILPTTALISDSSDLSYSGDGIVTISNDYQFSDNKSLKLEMPINSSSNTQTYFNLGSDLEKQVKYDGSYIFSFRLLNDSLGITNQLINIKLNVFVNSLLTHTFVIEKQQSYYSPRNFYTFCQSFNLLGNDIVNFTFEVDSDPIAPNPTLKLYFSGFKLELDDRFLGIPSIYSKPKDYDISNDKLLISETQWDVTDIGTQVVANGASLNLFTLIDNALDKNTTNTDSFDELNIVSNSIVTTYRNCKTIHLIRLSLNIVSGSDQYYQIQIRRTTDDSVVYRALLQRNADETIQTIEMTTRTLSAIDPFVVDGFYLAFVNNSGASATIDDALSLVIISNYQKAQKV